MHSNAEQRRAYSPTRISHSARAETHLPIPSAPTQLAPDGGRVLSSYYRTNPTDRLIAGSRARRLNRPARDLCKPSDRALAGGGDKVPSSCSEHPGLTHVLIRFACGTLLSLPTLRMIQHQARDSQWPRLSLQCELERRSVPTCRAAGASFSGASSWRWTEPVLLLAAPCYPM
jgi:hypothetical protein